jgi:pyruvate kinase
MNNNTIDNFAKTKILVTLGPATETPEIIKKLLLAGMDGVRLNFSHGSYEFYDNLFKSINEACTSEHTPLAILADLQGPKIRVGELIKPEIELVAGNTIEITINQIVGDANLISTSYISLVDDAQIGDPVLVDDGLIRLRIIEKKTESVICFIENGGILKPRKGMNLPGMKLSTPSVTEKDYNDLQYLKKHRIDFIALSFVRSPADIVSLREWMRKNDFVKPIIAKIEKKEAVDNFDAILEVSDGIMIARGDLGVELPPEQVPVIQKQIIRKCNSVGKLVITATQMLESMILNPSPTRAEASDVANAVWDGTDVVMLSGETSIGKFPFRVVQLMNDIIRNAESYSNPFNYDIEYEVPSVVEKNLFDSVGRAVTSISKQINAAAIVVFSYKGITAINLSKYRPAARIIAFSNSFDTMNYLCLKWGVNSLFLKDIDKEKIAVEEAKSLLLSSGQVKEGDIVIFTAGAPYSEKSRFNWLRFEVI